MNKLYQLIGTMYIGDWLLGELRTILSSQEEVDLAFCKFTDLSVRVLYDFYGKCKMINSADERLNNILQFNAQAIQHPKVDSIPLSVDFRSRQDIIHYIKTIDTKKIYNLKNILENRIKCLSLAIILTLKYHRNIMIDLGFYASDLFKQVRMDWLKHSSPQVSYFEVIGMAIVKRQVSNGKIYRNDTGWVDESFYIREFIVLPASFGMEDLTKAQDFKEVWTNAAMNLFNTVITKKTMKDYIELIQ